MFAEKPLPKRNKVRHLAIVLGDQLNCDSLVFSNWDFDHDLIWMAEVLEESTHVWSHKTRIALFLSAMRHFCDQMRAKHYLIDYHYLDDPQNSHSLALGLQKAIQLHQPKKCLVVEPGDYRVRESLIKMTGQLKVPLEILSDRHFLCTGAEFQAHAKGRKSLRMEFFYREMRKKYGVLMDDGQPVGGEWNFDTENRGSFGKKGPGSVPEPVRFLPDATTQKVLSLVEKTFPNHPGELKHFDWPVTPEQSRLALDDFIEHRLENFGKYQDAMWQDEPFLYHSRISAALNLKLLNPRVVISEAEKAFREERTSLASAEGFIRQILGWREYIRGIYWYTMPGFAEWNKLDAHEPLPAFYWTADTSMNCLKQAIGQSLEYGYAHHIQRLMVTGLFSLLLGVEPKQIHEWYLAIYVDAVEWVEMPNTIGMSQFADGGLLGSKPYIATGKYIQRMSNYCQNCPYDPEERLGEKACPFTLLYWDFLMRHETMLSGNPRMIMQLRNLNRLNEATKSAIQKQAKQFRISLPVFEKSK